MESKNFSLLPDHKPSAMGSLHVKRGCPATVWLFILWQKATEDVKRVARRGRSEAYLVSGFERFTFQEAVTVTAPDLLVFV
jgi:sulfur transfer protein SufE